MEEAHSSGNTEEGVEGVGGVLEDHWEGPGVIQVREPQGLGHTTAMKLGSRGPMRGHVIERTRFHTRVWLGVRKKELARAASG